MAVKKKKIQKKISDLRSKLWPELDVEELWDRHTYDGFTTIPRILPLTMSIIDDLTKGVPASKTYFELWCRAHDEMYVSLSKAEEMAFHAGFNGQRAKRTWCLRLRALEELGFIKIAAGAAGDYSHAVIINPYIALRRLHQAGTAGLTTRSYNAVIERGTEIGAKDVDNDPLEK